MTKGGASETAGRLARRMLAAVLLVLIAPVVNADASSRLCRQLEAQLAATRAGGSGSAGQAKRYDSAIARQQQQIQKAREQARQAGCGRAMIGRAVAFCGSLNATLERMDGNLADLQRTRAKMGGGNNRRERARIMAAIDVNGCRAPQRSLPEPINDGTRGQAVIDGRTGLRIGGLSGRFRTLCVRTCDGYYFPVSYSVSQTAFERDAKACTAMCPGAEVELHYHRVPGEESEAMVSAVTGLPYTEMSSAFLYRQTNPPPGCGCGAPAQGERGFEVIAGDHDSGMAEDETGEAPADAIPHPSERPDPAEDPETLASRDGGLDAETLKRLATPQPKAKAPAASEDGERRVRVVGPTFLPDPEAAIDLQARDPLRAR